MPILKHIFNLSINQQYFTTICQIVAIIPLSIKGNYNSAKKFKPICILNYFSKIFEFVIHDHIAHYVKLRSCEHSFTTSRYIVTNLVTFLDYITPFVRNQRQAD
jgi:hypothetical protein